MSEFVLKDGQGTLHRNDKDGNDARPDMRGELNIGGTIYRLAGWTKSGKNGKWLSLKAEIPQERPAASTGRKPVDPDADIPW
jgi:hypothetical protein